MYFCYFSMYLFLFYLNIVTNIYYILSKFKNNDRPTLPTSCLSLTPNNRQTNVITSSSTYIKSLNNDNRQTQKIIFLILNRIHIGHNK
jgi:hypothetical protein